MNRQDIYEEIENERAYQLNKWSTGFDESNSPNDWVAYVTKYAGQAVTMPWNGKAFRAQLLKVATLCVAALERDSYAGRHYDNDLRVS